MSRILHHILVATDGSDTGNLVVAFAIALARRHASELLLCYAVDHAGAIAESSTSNGGAGLVLPLAHELDVAARSILAEAAKRVTDAGLVATSAVLEGRPAHAIVRLAKERHVDAIVMGTQGKGGLERLFMGSTADGVVRHTDVPTFVVPRGAKGRETVFDCVLSGIDDSDPSDAAAAFALDVAKGKGTRLVLCAVVESIELLEKAATYGYDPMSMLDELRATATALLAARTERARADGVACESVIAEGDPAEKILKAAEVHGADLIVVGTHGRRGLRRLFVGSVAENIVRRSTVPVVIVRGPGSTAKTKA